jgi:hypothetical protein
LVGAESNVDELDGLLLHELQQLQSVEVVDLLLLCNQLALVYFGQLEIASLLAQASELLLHYVV